VVESEVAYLAEALGGAVGLL